MNGLKGFTPKAREAVANAIAKACALGHNHICSEHLLLGLLSVSQGAAYTALTIKGISAGQVTELIIKSTGQGRQTVLKAENLTPICKRILDNAAIDARNKGSLMVGTEHLLIALLNEKESCAFAFLNQLGCDTSSLYKSLNDTFFPINDSLFEKAQKSPPQKQVKTQNLDRYSKDLTVLAQFGKLDPVIGREKEISRVVEILARRQKNNPCLVGEAGVGKTAIAEGLAQRIADKSVPMELIDKRIVSLDLSQVLAGTKYRGDFEERIKTIIAEVIAAGNIILFIDEIHNIMGIGAAEGAIDAANILKPQLSRGEIQILGATTFTEYKKHIQKDSALERRFQSVIVNEPTESEAVEILKGLKPKYEEHHKLVISDEAIKTAVKMSMRYINDRFLPDKALDLIDESASHIRIAGYKAQHENDFSKIFREFRISKSTEAAAMMVTPQDIAQTISRQTGIKLADLTEEECERLQKMEEALTKQVIGQQEAAKTVACAIKRGRLGLKDPQHPIGSFLFLGPTGVGKTQLAKVLSKFLFGSESSMIRFDMSEYMEKHSVSKLIGSPPGYAGYDDGGILTDSVRKKPYSVILFDEIEKANPDVLHILLQVLDDGILTDSKGKKASFKNCVIIMTSNIGADKIMSGNFMGFSDNDNSMEKTNKEIKSDVIKSLKKALRPELLNRVDDIVVFKQLNEESVFKICRLLLEDVIKLLNDKGISISFSDKAIALLAKKGYHKEYGARPLKRVIRREVEDNIATLMLNKNIKEGTRIICDCNNDNITLTVCGKVFS